MKLLSAPKKSFRKDVSQATERVCELDIQDVSPETLTELLGLSGMRVDRIAIELIATKEGKTDYIHLFCEHVHDVGVCPECGNISQKGYDSKQRSVRHLDIFGKRTIVHFKQRRFDCDVCNKPFSEELGWIATKRRQTIKFEQYIYESVKDKKMSRRNVALQEGLDESTVSDIFNKYAQGKIDLRESQKVRVLGIDEIHLGNKKFALVISDLERNCVIAVLPNRLKATLEEWFDEELTEEERKAIKIVSIDMWKPYRQASLKMLPHAEIVADRFHVMKQLTHQLDLLRRNLRKNGSETLKELLKNSRWILLKNRDNLTPEQEAKLLLILAESSEIRKPYLLKERFRMICNKIKNRKKAESFLKAWLWEAKASGSRYLKRFAKTLENWWDEFLNYFNEGVTQGFVEGINRAIRGIMNRAFGFHIFENFRLQILVECGDT